MLVDQDTAPADYKVKTRQRRSPTELKEWTIETAVVADHTVADVHKNDTVPFLLTVMNLVSSRTSSASCMVTRLLTVFLSR